MPRFFPNDVASRETDSADKNDDAGTDDPGQERGTYFVDEWTCFSGFLDCAAFFAAAAYVACYRESAFSFRFFGWARAGGGSR